MLERGLTLRKCALKSYPEDYDDVRLQGRDKRQDGGREKASKGGGGLIRDVRWWITAAEEAD